MTIISAFLLSVKSKLIAFIMSPYDLYITSNACVMWIPTLIYK